MIFRKVFFWTLTGAIVAMLNVAPALAGAKKYATEKEWVKCSARVEKNSKAEVADGLVSEIVGTCGPKPLTKTDCDNLYRTLSDECISSSYCDMPYCMATNRTLMTLDISGKEFDNFCTKACRTKATPTRKEFGKKVCGGK